MFSYVKTYFKSYGREVVDKLTPSGSVPGKLYCRIKIHKKGYPARPVVSMINTPEYQLAKFMDRLIKPYIPNECILDSTQNVLQKMNQFIPQKHQVTVSFYVISLFTNVPLAETIELIASYVHVKDNPSCPAFNKDIFVKLMFKPTQGLFLYKDEPYQQINGVTMGSPLGPTLASFFMANLETKLINKLQTSKPKLYLRYVDNIFEIFDNQEACSSFFRQLNAQHPDIKFTVEQSTTTLSFLDVEIKVTGNKFDTWVWRKSTDTGLLLNFAALCPKNWKEGLVTCLLHRAKNICLTKDLFQNKVRNLRQLFSKNGYPTSFFNQILENFLNQNNGASNQDLNSSKSQERKFFLTVPYLGKPSTTFLKNIRVLIKSKLDIEITLIFKTTKISSYFNIKSRTPSNLHSNVVYKHAHVM